MKKHSQTLLVALVSFGAGVGAMLFYQAHGPVGYSGMETREIKALSADEVAGLIEGRGLGYALSAELNGYPGPRHVLELSDKLALTSDQKQETQELFAEMKSEASSLGQNLVAAERFLDQRFSNRLIDVQKLENLTREIAAIEGKLRATHLRYHLAMMDVLTPKQVEDYLKLRGYAGGGHAGH
jgi:Spy/CpxP family protein refolding chaperone